MPLIFGGDFNMRHSEDRWAGFSRYHPLTLVHEVCVDPASGCEVRMSWDGDAPWMDTQDLQFFADGERVTMRPIRVEALFEGEEEAVRELATWLQQGPGQAEVATLELYEQPLQGIAGFLVRR